MPENSRFSLAANTAFVPFWRRFPNFFLYPLQTGTVLRLAMYSVAGGVAMLIGGVFGTAVHFVAFAIFLKYALMVLGRTANGRFDEPDGIEDNGEGTAGQVLRQLGLICVMGLLASLLERHFDVIGDGLGWLITSVLTPAGIMIIATSRSLLQALNPAQVVHVIRTIGSQYLALCFIVLSLTGSEHSVQSLLARHMNSLLLPPLFAFAEFYFALITYHMIGYAIYQYHEDLGLRAAVSFEEAQAKMAPSKVADPALAQLGALVAEGHLNAAIDLLQGELRSRWENNDLHNRYQKLLIMAGKQGLAMQHAREFIHKLVSEKRMFQALDLCQYWLKADPEFRVQDPGQVHELAAAANLANRRQLALELIREFEKRYPEHPHIPAIRMLTAKILGEHLCKTSEAMLILQTLESDYPTHAVTLEARRYMKTLSKLAEIA